MLVEVVPLVGWLYDGQEKECKDALYARLMPGLRPAGLPSSWLPIARPRRPRGAGVVEWKLSLEKLGPLVERVASGSRSIRRATSRPFAACGLEWIISVDVTRLSQDGPGVQLAVSLDGSFRHVPEPDHDHEVLRSVGWLWPALGQRPPSPARALRGQRRLNARLVAHPGVWGPQTAT
jgi:hypothetical protein